MSCKAGHCLSNKKAGMDYLLSNCWSEGSFRLPQILEAIAIGYPAELDGEIPLLKTLPTSLNYRIWRNQAGPDLEASSPLRSFQGAVHTIREGNESPIFYLLLNTLHYGNNWSGNRDPVS